MPGPLQEALCITGGQMMFSQDDDEISILRQHLQNLKDRASAARKAGMDTKIVEIKLMNIAPKIMLAKATGQKKDAQLVQSLVADIEEELKQLRKEERFEDVLKKVEEEELQRLTKMEKTDYVKLSQDEVIVKTNNLISQARGYLDNRQYEKVFPIYLEIQGIYRYLPKDLKERVYAEAIDIYDRLRQSGIFRSKSRFRLLLARVRRRFGL
jgi:hypothetical protein